jgi:mannose-6-phosphate isomerase-like protein (cupin superfamily)
VTSADPASLPRRGNAPFQPVRLDAGAADITALNQLAAAGARAGNEQPADAARLDEVIPKPWGHEYRAFADEYFDFWCLHIGPSHATSTHVHPRKLTYLICLAGTGVTSGLSARSRIAAGTMLRIAPGAFHTTRNTGSEPLELIEVEVPRNKLDLLRLSDDYSRAGTGYESQSQAAPELPMRMVPHRPNTRMRDRTPDGRFRFELRTGMDIFYRRRAADVCYVPLCLSGVVSLDVQILARDGGQPPDTAMTYLCITRGE